MDSLLAHPFVLLLVHVMAEKPEKVNHWIIGGVALFILWSAMFALLAFGKGREHS